MKPADPYEIIPGCKKMPEYECSLCGDYFPAEQLKDAEHFHEGYGEWDSRQLCFRCASLVGGQWDWKVFP